MLRIRMLLYRIPTASPQPPPNIRTRLCSPPAKIDIYSCLIYERETIKDPSVGESAPQLSTENRVEKKRTKEPLGSRKTKALNYSGM